MSILQGYKDIGPVDLSDSAVFMFWMKIRSFWFRHIVHNMFSRNDIYENYSYRKEVHMLTSFNRVFGIEKKKNPFKWV